MIIPSKNGICSGVNSPVSFREGTWRIVLFSKWLGSPSFIRHSGNLEEEYCNPSWGTYDHHGTMIHSRAISGWMFLNMFVRGQICKLYTAQRLNSSHLEGSLLPKKGNSSSNSGVVRCELLVSGRVQNIYSLYIQSHLLRMYSNPQATSLEAKGF